MSTKLEKVIPEEEMVEGEGGEAAETAEATEATEATEAAGDGDGEGEAEDEADAEIEAIKQRVREMEEEAKKIAELQNNVQKSLAETPAAEVDAAEVDARSIYVGNVDYSTTQEELQEFFKSCGAIVRVTIPVDKWSESPKGFGYVEFKDAEGVENAFHLNDTQFKGREIKIKKKRTNVPAWQLHRGRGRGRGRGGYYMPRGRGRGGYRGRGAYYRRPWRGRRSSPY